MGAFLSLVGLLVGAFGFFMLFTIATTALHEIEAFILLLIGAVFFCSGCLVTVIDKPKYQEIKQSIDQDWEGR
jgi:hypothetical protein